MRPAYDFQSKDAKAVFVGNGKFSSEDVKRFAAGDLSVLRPALRMALSARSNIAVWGRYGGIKFPGHVNDTISFRKIGALYRQAGVILNDHTKQQVEFSALNNRVFDGLASARPVLTTVPKDASSFLPNIVSGLREFSISDSIEKFSQLLHACTHVQSNDLLDLSASVRKEHSFDARAEMIIRRLKS